MRRHVLRTVQPRETEPAKLLAVFVVDTAQQELTFPIKK